MCDLAVGLVLRERIDGPDRRRNPAEQGALQHQAEQAGEGSSDEEESEPRKEEGDQQSHVWRIRWGRCWGSVGDVDPSRMTNQKG